MPGTEVLKKATANRRRKSSVGGNSPIKGEDQNAASETTSEKIASLDSSDADTTIADEPLSRRIDNIERAQSQVLTDVHDIKRTLRSLTDLMQKVHKEFESSPRNMRRNTKHELDQ